jgi:hypothetical protein
VAQSKLNTYLRPATTGLFCALFCQKTDTCLNMLHVNLHRPTKIASFWAKLPFCSFAVGAKFLGIEKIKSAFAAFKRRLTKKYSAKVKSCAKT